MAQYQYRRGQRVKYAIEELGGHVSIWSHWDHSWGNPIGADLSQAEVSDDELAKIVELPMSGTLRLDGTAITDDGLANIRKLGNLQCLSISDTNVSDEGLKHLERVEMLLMLQAHQTKITDEGAADLKQALPGLDVYCRAP